MICDPCRNAGDSITKAKQFSNVGNKREADAFFNRARILHDKCDMSDCFCQHRLEK